MEELFKFTLLVRDRNAFLIDRFAGRNGDVNAAARAAPSGSRKRVPARVG